MMLMHGAHLWQFASRLQKTVALSSREAELNAQVMGATEGLGVTQLCEEWHICSDLACFCDSSAARGIASRAGVGKMKHLAVRQLWIQEKVREGRVAVSWISRGQNSADALTHPCPLLISLSSFVDGARRGVKPALIPYCFDHVQLREVK